MKKKKVNPKKNNPLAPTGIYLNLTQEGIIHRHDELVRKLGVEKLNNLQLCKFIAAEGARLQRNMRGGLITKQEAVEYGRLDRFLSVYYPFDEERMDFINDYFGGNPDLLLKAKFAWNHFVMPPYGSFTLSEEIEQDVTKLGKYVMDGKLERSVTCYMFPEEGCPVIAKFEIRKNATTRWKMANSKPFHDVVSTFVCKNCIILIEYPKAGPNGEDVLEPFCGVRGRLFHLYDRCAQFFANINEFGVYEDRQNIIIRYADLDFPIGKPDEEFMDDVRRNTTWPN